MCEVFATLALAELMIVATNIFVTRVLPDGTCDAGTSIPASGWPECRVSAWRRCDCASAQRKDGSVAHQFVTARFQTSAGLPRICALAQLVRIASAAWLYGDGRRFGAVLN